MTEQFVYLLGFICPRHRDVVTEQFAYPLGFICPRHRDVVTEQLFYLISSPLSFSVLICRVSLYLFMCFA